MAAIQAPVAASIARCELVLEEVNDRKIRQIIKLVFGELEKDWGDAGSPFQRWYRTATSPSLNGRTRHIAWRSDKPFLPENLFFRAVDSGRLLPVHLATFRVQFYAHRSFWQHLDRNNTREKWTVSTLSGIMHELLLLRSMHDTGGADIPIILTSWDLRAIDAAMNYWSELSKGEWSEEQRNQKYSECDSKFCRRILPCFPQADLLVRSLLSDPAVGYVPPFIIIIPSQRSDGPCARALFTDPSYNPPRSLIQNWPKTCGAPLCEESNCAFFDLDACSSLSPGSAMVRDRGGLGKRVVCNLWGCEVQNLPEKQMSLQQCQRCKEVFYCSRLHQKLDWGLHKTVCERES